MSPGWGIDTKTDRLTDWPLVAMWLWLWFKTIAATLTSRQLIWSAGSNDETPSSNTASRRKEDRPARSYPAADTRKTSWLAVAQLPTQRRPAGSQSPGRWRKVDQRASPLRLEFCQRSLGAPCLRYMALFRGHDTLPVTAHSACLPAHPYTLLTAINTCYRNLCGCFSVLPEPTTHTDKVIYR
jgi:hypothetical protein